MWPKYSRPIVQLSLIVVFGSLAFWSVKAGYRWMPLLALVAYLVTCGIILPKLPRPIFNAKEAHDKVSNAAAALRRLAVVSLIGLSVTTLLLLVSGLKMNGVPRWGIVLTLLWSWFLVWCYFRGARWYKNRAATLGQSSHKAEE